MADAKTGAEKPDAEISPMEAQNEGPARKASAREPVPATTTGHGARGPEPVDGGTRSGGEAESRDDR